MTFKEEIRSDSAKAELHYDDPILILSETEKCFGPNKRGELDALSDRLRTILLLISSSPSLSFSDNEFMILQRAEERLK